MYYRIDAVNLSCYTNFMPAMQPLSEADTRAKLIDPALHHRGWTEDLAQKIEET